MPSVNFGIRLPVELIERADARAELEDRTRAQVIRRALQEHLAKPAPGEHADTDQSKVATPRLSRRSGRSPAVG